MIFNNPNRYLDDYEYILYYSRYYMSIYRQQNSCLSIFKYEKALNKDFINFNSSNSHISWLEIIPQTNRLRDRVKIVIPNIFIHKSNHCHPGYLQTDCWILYLNWLSVFYSTDRFFNHLPVSRLASLWAARLR